MPISFGQVGAKVLRRMFFYTPHWAGLGCAGWSWLNSVLPGQGGWGAMQFSGFTVGQGKSWRPLQLLPLFLAGASGLNWPRPLHALLAGPCEVSALPRGPPGR